MGLKISGVFFGEIFNTTTLRQSLITSSGTIINGVLGAFFYVLLARQLGPTDFGVITISIAVLTLIADIADLGINTGIVRFVPGHLKSNDGDSYRFLKLSLLIKLLVSVLVVLIGYFVSPFIATYIFGKEGLILPLQISMLGVVGALLFSYSTASLQAFQKFREWSFINILTNGLRLLAVLLLIYLGYLNLVNSLSVYILLPFFGFLAAMFFLPMWKILEVKNESGVFRQLFKYNSQVSLFVLVAAVSSRLDTFLVAKFLNSSEVGIYGAANQLTVVLPQLIGALGTVVAPKFASYSNSKEMLIYFKKLQYLCLGIAALIILSLPLAVYLIPILLGQNYFEATGVFVILIFAQLIFLISIPVHNSIFYFFSKPKLFIWLSLGHLMIIGGLGYYLISNFGMYGAAITVLTGMVFNFVVPLVWFFRKIK